MNAYEMVIIIPYQLVWNGGSQPAVQKGDNMFCSCFIYLSQETETKINQKRPLKLSLSLTDKNTFVELIGQAYLLGGKNCYLSCCFFCLKNSFFYENNFSHLIILELLWKWFIASIIPSLRDSSPTINFKLNPKIIKNN